MAATLDVKGSITPTGTTALFSKEDPEKLRAFIREQDVQLRRDKSSTPLPSHVQFGIIRDPRVVLRKAIPVTIKRDGDVSVAAWEEAEEFGYGSNRSEAIEDFSKTISQLFVTLTREEDSLGPALLNTLELLGKHLQFRG